MNTSTSTTATLELADLKSALARIKPAVWARRDALPILSCVRLESIDGTIYATASNLDLTLSAPVGPGELEPIAVDFGRLVKLAARKGSAVLDFHGDELAVTMGATTVTLRCLPVTEWPAANYGATSAPFTLNPAAVGDILTAVSVDDARPILAAVYVTGTDYVATDSYRLHAVRGMDTGLPTSKDRPGILIPRDAAKVIAGQYAAPVTATLYTRDLEVVGPDGFRLVTRLVDGEFPRWEGLLPTNARDAAVWDDVDVLRAAVKDLVGLQKVMDAEVCPMRFVADGPALQIVSQDVGDIETTFSGAVTIPAAFNPRYFLDALTGADFGSMTGVDQLKPFLLEEAADSIAAGATRVRLLMPVRVS